ncbi:hypothetical protein F5876DRAFT_37837 [Lentinula aff. lateritia]|uniref:Uncharacterized protein n=1 Tax=Lentinula aff. lateritia TaxID=2804960 RepID=A0ACC1U6D1_9AGAR|nr:hypothetical protein F5876DRAFT_37837 [Lentinula aff. lateritia]
MLRQNRSQSLNPTNNSSARSKANAGSVSSLSRTNSSHLRNKDYAIGILLLLVVVFLWTTSNFDLFQDGYEKAFLVTYLNTSAFSLYLLPFLIKSFLPKITTTWRFRKTARYERPFPIPFGSQDSGQYEPLHSEGVYADDNSVEVCHQLLELVRLNPYVFRPSENSELPPFTVRETADLAFIFCFIWFAANWTLNASLDYTSVASATILSSTSGFFTLGLGRIFHVETLTLAKIGAVSTSFVGVLLVALSDSSQTSSESDNLVSTWTSTRRALGDSLALFSALFYTLYVILLKVRIRSESRIDMKMFFGFVGLFNIILCWPIGVILHLTGVERFELPSSDKAVGALLVNMAITWSSDYLYVLAMLKTTPLVVTIGLSLTIPLAVLGDFFLSNPVRLPVLAGALLVLMSFVVVGVDDANAEQQQQDLVDSSRNLVDDPDSRGRRRLSETVELESD